MAIVSARAKMEVHGEEEVVHPFFGKRTKSHESLPPSDHVPFHTTWTVSQSTSTPAKDEVPQVRGRGKAGNCTRPDGSDDLNAEPRTEPLHVDLNKGRRKRQKTASPQNKTTDNRLPDTGRLTSANARNGLSELRAQLEVAAATANDVYKHSTENAHGTAFSEVFVGKAFAHPAVLSSDFTTTVDVQNPSATFDNAKIDIDPSTLSTRKVVIHQTLATNETALIVSKPQKTLRLNPKTGTIGSPPAKKSTRTVTSTESKIYPRRAVKQAKSLIVTLKYGCDNKTRSSIGEYINHLLKGTETFSSPCKPPPRPPKSISQPGPPKVTHPFFLGKAAPKTPTPEVAEATGIDVTMKAKISSSKSSMTLGEAKSHIPAKRLAPVGSIAAFDNFGKATKIMKFPGAVEPCWPPRGMIHIRGTENSLHMEHNIAKQVGSSAQRKSKYNSTETLARDDILQATAARLGINDILERLAHADTDGFVEPEKCLRLPQKHFETGFHIQRRVRRELSVRLPLVSTFESVSSSGDDLQHDGNGRDCANPALLKVYDAIPTSLTAFDRSEYETQSWIHKYAPRAAAEVLQRGREAFILKEWLQSLTVISVDTGTGDNARSQACSVASRRSAMSKSERPGRRKRKSKKLEGFVISSDEEEDDMDEISDPEDDSPPRGSHGLLKKTVVRSGDAFARRSQDSGKLANAVVISGPSGCGKTAMVYGVARELEFEVFEINSSSRRSGKDILERVGDMTRNHLVHHAQGHGPADPQHESTLHISDVFTADLETGRQQTMNSFFKRKKTTNPNPRNASSVRGRKHKIAETDSPKPLKLPPKQQKQSLIFLEEVDILFEEDKQFWATIMSLITQSKRPIIMTCNDEALIPLKALSMHAIIRLAPPLPDIATDYMLLVAAAEGHIVKRRAVKALYEARGCDLRASLTELEYWCQLGVGDRKGGLDWFYPRWPPGCDVDERGHTIRVVSEGTYKTGMGWLGRDFSYDRCYEPEVKEEVLREAWDGWHVDVGDWHDTLDVASLIGESQGVSKAVTLASYEAFIESMSTADVCACGSLATDNQTLLDITAPPTSAKTLEDFIIGYELLQADSLACFESLHRDVSFWIQSQARELLQATSLAKLKAPSEAQISANLASLRRRKDDSITRQDFSAALDPIAGPEWTFLQTASSLEASVFDRTTSVIAVDIAPFVRSVVAYDTKLQEERARLSNLLSEGGRRGKRVRTTRSAISALEGGARRTTRPDRYFGVALNPHFVIRTGLQCWQDAVASEMARTNKGDTEAVLDGPEGSSPGMTDSS